MAPLAVIDPVDLERAAWMVVALGGLGGLVAMAMVRALALLVSAVAGSVIAPLARIRSARERRLQDALDKSQRGEQTLLKLVDRRDQQLREKVAA